jgi:exodeoxyribonuclease V alpha subunit
VTAPIAAFTPYGPDPHDSRRPAAGDGLLRELADATVLTSADVRTALTLAELGDDHDPDVALAAALAVRAVRLGHVLVDLTTVAGTAAPDDEDVGIVVADLDWPSPDAWLTRVAASRLVAVGLDGPPDRPLRLLGSHLYLDRYWRDEQAIAVDIGRRAEAGAAAVDLDLLATGLDRLFPAASGGAAEPDAPGALQPDELQRAAAATAVLRRFAVVAGGPGTGKTTTVARIVALLHEQAEVSGEPLRLALVAPTGKAAARLTEAVHGEAAGLDIVDSIRASLLATEASTIHRLLGWRGSGSRFRHDRTNPLPHQAVVVDESSMVSLALMARLLDAIRPDARVILVGDPHQLSSVEAGAVLGDVVGPAADRLLLRPDARARLEAAIGSPVDADDPGAVAIGDGIVVLRRVHRFGGAIAAVADAVAGGDGDRVIATLAAGHPDVRWIPTEADQPVAPLELAEVRTVLLDTATRVVASASAGRSRDALDALRSVQVLCAHRRGAWGASWWRFEIERWLRSAIPGYGIGAWYPGRPLLVTENDRTLGVFNGDTGVVVDEGGGKLRAVFDRRGEPFPVRPARLAAVDSLYAITIHKAQGSQFGSVVVVLPEPTSPILTRELLYTGVTRAQEHLTVIGSEASIRAAVDRPVARASGLADALWGGQPKVG